MHILMYDSIPVGIAKNSMEAMALIYGFLEAAKSIEGLEVSMDNFTIGPVVTGKLLVPEIHSFNDGNPLGFMQMFAAEKNHIDKKDAINKLIEGL